MKRTAPPPLVRRTASEPERVAVRRFPRCPKPAGSPEIGRCRKAARCRCHPSAGWADRRSPPRADGRRCPSSSQPGPAVCPRSQNADRFAPWPWAADWVLERTLVDGPDSHRRPDDDGRMERPQRSALRAPAHRPSAARGRRTRHPGRQPAAGAEPGRSRTSPRIRFHVKQRLREPGNPGGRSYPDRRTYRCHAPCHPCQALGWIGTVSTRALVSAEAAVRRERRGSEAPPPPGVHTIDARSAYGCRADVATPCP